MIKIICPECSHSWKFRGKGKRVQCRDCGHFFYNPAWKDKSANLQVKPANLHKSANLQGKIADNVLSGNIIEAIKQVGINPKKKVADIIPMILQNGSLELGLAKASRDRKRSPETIIRIALKDWLKRGKYL